MLTELQEKKQTHYFRLVDVDNNGFIEPADWQSIGKRLAAKRGIPEGTPEFEGVLATMATVWENLSQYVNGEQKNRASLEEWLKFEDERVVNCDDDWYNEYVNTIVKGVFALMDEDGDGLISAPEYAKFITCFGVDFDDAVAGFNRMDINKDGEIDESELIESVLQFHRSDDPEAPGNWLFGPYDKYLEPVSR